MIVQIGWAARPKRDEEECGDRVAIIHDAHGGTLVSVIDGLGHGPHAAEAARRAERFLVENAPMPLPELVRRCDLAISDTRGVAIALIRLVPSRSVLIHAAIGNVELLAAARPYQRIMAQPGVVGSRRAPSVRETIIDLSPGDLFVLVSDGVSSRLDLSAYRHLGPQPIADAIIREHGKDHDDASCAVVRC